MKRLIALLCIFSIFVCALTACSSKAEEPVEEQVKAICELATLECYYNNVAIAEQEKGNGWSHILEKDRHLWIEYEGVAKIGIDMSLVSMSVTDNVVTVTMPKAKLLSTAVLTETFNVFANKDSFWNKNEITVETQKTEVHKAQEKMKETVLANKALFIQAEDRAKELITNYINQLGEISGKEYAILWKNI